MKRSPITSPTEDRIRWICAIILPSLLLITLIFTVRISLESPVAIKPPPLELHYVVLEKPEEPEPEVPKPEPKPVERVVVESKPEPIAEPEPEVAPVEESPISEAVADIAVGEPTEDTTVSEPVVDAQPSEVAISSPEVLDNTSFAPVFNPKPSYPVIARRNRITGYVELDLTISDEGRVIDYEIVRSYGHPMFGVETSKVISRWRFPPPRIDGQRVSVIYRYRVKFELN